MDWEDLQKIPPLQFLIICEALANSASAAMPLNVQNTVGNGLMLLGQCIISFNAQQYLVEYGPGKCYHPGRINARNPDLPQNQSANQLEVNQLKEEIACLQKELLLLRRDLLLHQKNGDGHK